MTLATFRCFTCGDVVIDELPRMFHIEAWPCCCAVRSGS